MLTSLGVNILVILTIISGIILLIVGIGLLYAQQSLVQINSTNSTTTSFTFPSSNVNDSIVTNQDDELYDYDVVAFMVIAASIMILLGVASLIVAWGLLKGKGWAWITTMAIAIIAIIINGLFIFGNTIRAIETGEFPQLDVFTVFGILLIIDGVVIWYLYRPDVKSYFGRIKATTS